MTLGIYTDNHFPYFLHSCRYNPAVDFLIFTDNNDPNLELPANVKVIPYSIEQFKADAAKALGFAVAVESGYKLCDFKPAYGTIFTDYIRDYDFWGYCDIEFLLSEVDFLPLTAQCTSSANLIQTAELYNW